jgi:hypothetical protein
MEKVTSCPLDPNPSALQSFANCGVLDSLTNFIRPMNVAENTAPLLLLPAPQEDSSRIRGCILGATSMDVGLIHRTGADGLQDMPRHVPGSRLRQIVTYTPLPGIILT